LAFRQNSPVFYRVLFQAANWSVTLDKKVTNFKENKIHLFTKETRKLVEIKISKQALKMNFALFK
jgi:hypothetical protein